MSKKVERLWGWYTVLRAGPHFKVKELTILPGKGISLQRHFHRGEHWFISSGKCDLEYPSVDTLKEHDTFHVKRGEMHQLINRYEEPCKIIEIQYGTKVIEEDIEKILNGPGSPESVIHEDKGISGTTGRLRL